MDGVLVDFIRGISSVFDRKNLEETWTPGEWNAENILGISTNDFFGRIESQGYQFWMNLHPCPGAIDLFNYCNELAPTYILSSPTRDPNCLKGKMLWLQNYFGKNFRNFILTPKKEMCARLDKVLIDDNENNVESFRFNGGQGILYPSVVNKRHGEKNRAVEIVKSELISIKNLIHWNEE